MRKYYLSKIKQYTEPGIGTYWGHALQQYPNVDYVGGEIKIDPATGTPTEKALLVLVGSKHHALFKSDADLIEIPVGRDSLNIKLSAIETPTKLRFRRNVRDLGIAQEDIDLITDDTQSWKQIVNALGKKNNAQFDADAFDLDES